MIFDETAKIHHCLFEELLNRLKPSAHSIDFDKIPADTKTFIVITNIDLDLKKIYTNLLTYQDTRIIGMDPGSFDPNRVKKYFRNAFSLVIWVPDKKITCKLYENGKIQLTGCKKDVHALECIKILMEVIKSFPDKCWELKVTESDTRMDVTAMFIPVMRNINFDIGFAVDRDRLHRFICSVSNKYRSLSVHSMGHAGIIIKAPYPKGLEDVQLDIFSFESKRITNTRYENYLDTLLPRIKKEKLKKFATFIVFQSGKVIMSGGICTDLTKIVFDEFVQFLSIHRRYYNWSMTDEMFDRCMLIHKPLETSLDKK